METATGRSVPRAQQQPVAEWPRNLRALLASCGHCWPKPRAICTGTNGYGLHYARYQRANRQGLISDKELRAIRETFHVADGGTIIPDPAA
jgi:hypothetical protein